MSFSGRSGVGYFHQIGLLLLVVFLDQTKVMGSCFLCNRSLSGKLSFSQPSSIPTFPPGGNFARGSIDLGGLDVSQVSTFNQVWATHNGGPDNQGATFYEPSALPEGYFILGFYAQGNNKPLFGHVLVAKDHEASGTALVKPVDYILVWSSENSNIWQDGVGYVWLPVPPEGYKALGYVVTANPSKPSLENLRCVRADFTEPCQAGEWIWGQGDDGVSIVDAKPVDTAGTRGLGVPVGTFATQNAAEAGASPISCLKNNKTSDPAAASMPNTDQIRTLMESYGPLVYLHPDEEFFPSSVTWFFDNGALLYQKGDKANPVRIDTRGSNLPQGWSDDETFWLDLPTEENAREYVKKGDLSSFKAYLHVKPMFGATITDIVIWLFYPFNGAAKAKTEFFNVKLGRIGSHISDWEHMTLRISNFNGELQSVYLSEHSSGTWLSASQLEYQNGNSKPVVYASHHGHALYPDQGLVLQGSKELGLRNDMARSDYVMDIGTKFEIVSADYLGIVEPPWLNYLSKWGPKISYNVAGEISVVRRMLFWKKLKRAFDKFLNELPKEFLGQDGPTGPKAKPSWDGDEAY